MTGIWPLQRPGFTNLEEASQSALTVVCRRSFRFLSGGILSDLRLEEIADRLNTIQKKTEELGFRFHDAASHSGDPHHGGHPLPEAFRRRADGRENRSEGGDDFSMMGNSDFYDSLILPPSSMSDKDARFSHHVV
jgi:hypothetical protein